MYTRPSDVFTLKQELAFPENTTLEADWLSGTHTSAWSAVHPGSTCSCLFVCCVSDSFFSDPSHEHTLPRNANVKEASSGQRARARSAVFTVCFHVWLLNGRWRLAAAELNFHGDKRVSDLARRRNFDERKPGGFSGYSTLPSGSGGKKKPDRMADGWQGRLFSWRNKGAADAGLILF